MITNRAICIEITPKFGDKIGMTDYDMAIDLGSANYLPQNFVDIEKVISNTDFLHKASQFHIVMDKNITTSDLTSAKIEIFLIDYVTKSKKIPVFLGYIDKVAISDSSAKLEISNNLAKLNSGITRIYSNNCYTEFGSAKCDLNSESFKKTSVITEIIDEKNIEISPITVDLEIYQNGMIKTNNKKYKIISLTQNTISIQTEFTGNVGDVIEIFAGCSKEVSFCKSKFNNIINFRGFPHIPGNEYLYATGK